MDEFINRMDAQREVLKVVNKKQDFKEELCGLSKNALERWINVNRLDSASKICSILHEISDKLFFLANKSQEQITEEYKFISIEIANLNLNLEKLMG